MADHSALKKPKTTGSSIKKSDTSHKSSIRTERSQLSFDKVNLNEDTLLNNFNSKSTNGADEPYKCTGKFLDDFQNVCKQNQINYMPQIIHRNKRAITPNTQNSNNNNSDGKTSDINNSKIKLTKIKHTNLESQNDSLVVQNNNKINNSILSLTEDETNNVKDETNENMPKTFILVKDKYEYFKPKIQYESEILDKQDHVTELYIRGWKLEVPIMNVFQDIMPSSEKLISINFWNCGLNDETLDILASFLPKCANLKNVNLDGNPVSSQNFYKLIEGNSLIQNLSLRNCKIDDCGAQKLGFAIGNVNEQNTKLISLNLSGNVIGDSGACGLANGLRTNRTLLVLNLAGNQIGDKGAIKIAETLSRFKMTQEEIVKRRTIKRDRILKELALNPRIIKSDSTIQGQTQRGLKEMIKSGKTKTDTIGSATQTKDAKSKNRDLQSGRESSHDNKSSNPKSGTAGGTGKDGYKKDKETNHSNNTPNSASTTQKNKDKDNKKQLDSTLTSASGEKTLTKGSGGLKPKSPKKSGKVDSDSSDHDLTRIGSAKLSNTNLNLVSVNEPLMEEIENIDGDLWIVGNRTLISLNLSRNHLTSISLKKFILTIQYQMTLNAFTPKVYYSTGLLKLNLNKNDFPVNNEDYLKLNDLIKLKDPIAQKAIEQSSAIDAISSASKEGFSTVNVNGSNAGKETSRIKSSKHHI